MNNRERVIKALESCGKNNADCEHCSYYSERDCIHKVMQAALSILEGKADGISYCPYCKKPVKEIFMGIYFCQECGHMLPRCPKCHNNKYVAFSSDGIYFCTKCKYYFK